MVKIPSLAEMLKAGLHFGHQSSRWHPKMREYIFGARNGVHIIDLEKTQQKMEEALEYVKTLAAKGKVILFVGTKRQARDLVQAAAEACGMPYLTERWIGGLLTNFDELKRRLKKYITLTNEVASGEIEKYTKKEQLSFKKQLVKMDRYLRGLIKLEKLPDALYIADMRMEKTAVVEANRTKVPMVGVCDTNVNPAKASYAIPANDDAVGSIKMVVDLIAAAVLEGKSEWEKEKAVLAAKAEKDKQAALKAVAPKTERKALKKEESI